MINSVQSNYATQEIQRTSVAQMGHPTQSIQSDGDKVTLSPEGVMASFFSGLGIDYTPGQPISIDDMEAGLKQEKEELTDNINILFLENGISTEPPVELTTDSEGKVRVKGNHPDKERIEQLFEENPGLANDFRGVSAQDSFVRAGKEYLEFAKAYEEDPYAAVAKYGHFFDQLEDESFSMMFGGSSEEAV